MPKKKKIPGKKSSSNKAKAGAPAEPASAEGEPEALSSGAGPTITDVPQDQVGRVVQSFVDDGAEAVQVEATGGGFYSVCPS